MKITARSTLPLFERPLEVVERKGLGHPDSLCEALAEAAALSWARAQQLHLGEALPFNFASSCLMPGQSRPAYGGGEVLQPMRFILAGWAHMSPESKDLSVHELTRGAVREWLQDHVRFLDPIQHLSVEHALAIERYASKPGAEHNSLAEESVVAIGWAPETEVERVVLSAEHWLNSEEVKQSYPEVGQDVRLLGVRQDQALELMVDIAFVDRFLISEADWRERKRELEQELVAYLRPSLRQLQQLDLVCEVPSERYWTQPRTNLTVTGTTAESYVAGALGRGNRLSGLHNYQRTWGPGILAGTHVRRHTGRIYNQLAQHCARLLHDTVAGLEEVQVLLASRKGALLAEPWTANVKLVLSEGVSLADVDEQVRALLERQMAGVAHFLERQLVTTADG